MKERSKIYFISDLHLGMETFDRSREREKLAVSWLNSVREDAREIWFLGDVFDYWFEYRRVVPRGFTRFLGTLGDISDEGIEIHYFTGNHDVWVFDYLPDEVGMILHHKPITKDFNGKKFYLGHGDGYSPRDHGYLFIKKIFRNRFMQWCYARIHPNSATAFARWSSKKSRDSHTIRPYLGTENEDIIRYARKHSKSDPSISYYIFGHRHLAFDVELDSNTRVICLGDWIDNFTYACFDGEKLELKKFLEDRGNIIFDSIK